MGQGCSTCRSGRLEDGVGTKTPLEVAKEKIGEKYLNCLPTTRSEALWNDIRTECNLTTFELSALKNDLFADADPSPPRGVLPGIKEEAMYKISDSRVRCSFTITYVEGNKSMPAELMLDSGAEGELKLPGRKVVQLGLRQIGPAVRTRVSSNNRGSILNFTPHVMLSATFYREDKNGRRTQVVEAPMSVRAEESDYLAALEENNQASASNESSMPLTPPSERPAWLTATPTTPGETAGIASGTLNLTPVRHRPHDRPDEQATLGISGLAKLKMHINAEKHQLEIEEEEFILEE